MSYTKLANWMKDGYRVTGYASSAFCTHHVLDRSRECPSKRLGFNRAILGAICIAGRSKSTNSTVT